MPDKFRTRIRYSFRFTAQGCVSMRARGQRSIRRGIGRRGCEVGLATQAGCEACAEDAVAPHAASTETATDGLRKRVLKVKQGN